ncbi:MAG TPA: DUF4760 domain-containing protein [Patescibacteria group bacterium]|nr:DUF4760 domain-containing protein [Patescibacteria group bacterium]
MVDYQTLSVVFAGISVGLAAIYYALTLRKAEKNRQTTLDTRQAQLLMQIFQELTSDKRWKEYLEALYITEWEDYDDFKRKYGRENPDYYSKLLSLWWSYNSVGALVSEGLLDENKVDSLMGTMVVQQWEKWESVIKSLRADIGHPKAFSDFESLYQRVKTLEVST